LIVSHGYEHRRLKLLADQVVGNTVLDIGYAHWPNPFLGRFYRVGLDLNRPAADRSTRYDEELVGDVRNVFEAVRGRKFDTIICGELIEHLENPYQLLRDLRPLLREDGRLLVSTPNPLAIPVVVAEVFRLRRYFYSREHLYYFLPRWVERLFEATGYEVTALKAVGLWTPFGAIPLCPVALSYQVIYAGRVRPA
jgi:SAM-dependent methyltransferase